MRHLTLLLAFAIIAQANLALAEAPTPEQIRTWVSQLEDERFATRAAATDKLILAAPQAIPAVAKILAGEQAPELRSRAKFIVTRWCQSGDAAIYEALKAAGPDVAHIRDAMQAGAIRSLKQHNFRVERLPDGNIAVDASDLQKEEFKKGDWIRSMKGLAAPTKLSIMHMPIHSANLAQLAKVDSLVELSSDFYDLSREELAELHKLKSLKKLSFGVKAVTADTVKHLSKIQPTTKLHIEISCDSIADELKHLKELKSLEGLRFTLVLDGISDEAFAHLKAMKSLRKLEFFATRITNADLAHLKELDLTELVFCDEAITGTGIAHLKDIKSLKKLTFAGGSTRRIFGRIERWFTVSDGDLVHFTKMKSLTHLTFEDTGVTGRAADALRRSLPDCKIAVVKSPPPSGDDGGVAILKTR